MENNVSQLTNLGFLIVQLVSLKDYDFIEEVLDKYDITSYDSLPGVIEEELEDIFNERLMEIGEEDIYA